MSDRTSKTTTTSTKTTTTTTTPEPTEVKPESTPAVRPYFYENGFGWQNKTIVDAVLGAMKEPPEDANEYFRGMAAYSRSRGYSPRIIELFYKYGVSTLILMHHIEAK